MVTGEQSPSVADLFCHRTLPDHLFANPRTFFTEVIGGSSTAPLIALLNEVEADLGLAPSAPEIWLRHRSLGGGEKLLLFPIPERLHPSDPYFVGVWMRAGGFLRRRIVGTRYLLLEPPRDSEGALYEAAVTEYFPPTDDPTRKVHGHLRDADPKRFEGEILKLI